MIWLFLLFLVLVFAVAWVIRTTREPSRRETPHHVSVPRPAAPEAPPVAAAPEALQAPPPPENAAAVAPRAPAVRATLPAETLHRLNALVAGFPELPVGAQRIMLALHDMETTPQQIARLTGSDPALAGRILRAVNSSFYNLPHKVSDLSLAVVLLGYTQVRSLVLQSGIGSVLLAQDRRSRVELDTFWHHSFCAATCAFHFARKLGTVSPGQASTVGLLHDIGKPVWWWANPASQELGLPGVHLSTPVTLLEEERNSFGANHQALGALLALKWGLPGEVVRGIEYHHHPTVQAADAVPDDVRELSKVLWLADLAAHRFAVLMGDEIERESQEAVDRGGHLLDEELHRELLRARALLDPSEREPAYP